MISPSFSSRKFLKLFQVYHRVLGQTCKQNRRSMEPPGGGNGVERSDNLMPLLMQSHGRVTKKWARRRRSIIGRRSIVGQKNLLPIFVLFVGIYCSLKRMVSVVECDFVVQHVPSIMKF